MKLKAMNDYLNKNGAVMKKANIAVLIIAVTLSGCATSSKDISTNYVSPVQFQSYDCDQLQSEAMRIQARVNQLGGRLDEAASNDKAIMGVGMLLFWPALFALGGTKQQEAEYARLKGEYDAIQQSAVAKKCAGVVESVRSNEKYVAVIPTKTDDKSVTPNKTTDEKLQELKRLYDANLISPEVYKDRQKIILGS